MGTYINLSILPSNILNAQWEQVYEESLELINAFPFADVEIREFFGYKLPVYVKATEKSDPERHWTVRGDLKSKNYAESFKLFADISNYQTMQLEKSEKDILFEEDQKKIITVFNSKTQGYNYHLYVLAIGMLIESRLDGTALVSGDIDYDQCIKAKNWANKYLSSPIDIPVRVDFERLLSRIYQDASELDQVLFLEKLLIVEREKLFQTIYKHFSQETFLSWFSQKLKSYSSPTQLGALKLLIYYLNLTADLNKLLFICCNLKDGPKFDSSEMIKAIARTWICLSPDKFSYLDAFSKVSGHPQILEGQIGTVFLDMNFTGREIKTYMPPTEILKTLSQFFPELVNEIESSLKQELSRIEEKLFIFHKQIKSILDLAEATTKDKMYLANEDAFLHYNGETIVLTEDQELYLKAIAFSIKKFLNREGEVLSEFFFCPLEQLKLILVAFANEKFNMILTDQAWEWIDELDTPHLVRVLLAKLIIDDANHLKQEKFHSDILKAMFENKILTHSIAAYIEDENVMKEIEEYANKYLKTNGNC